MTPIDMYKKDLGESKVILVDFDNTICVDEWPFVGEFVPGAINTIKKLQSYGHKIILYTQRDTRYPVSCEGLEEFKEVYGGSLWNDDYYVDTLSIVLDKCSQANLTFWDINKNSPWEILVGDRSRKVFGDLLIDDHAAMIPTIEIVNSHKEICKVVDWKVLDLWFEDNGYYTIEKEI